jgi:Kdo2-lipid IVA lauroyltransferase/acyltransferase
MSPGKILKKIQHLIEYLAVRGFHLLVKLTPDKLRLPFAGLLAGIAQLLTRNRVEVARKNLALVFSESSPAEMTPIIRGVYKNIVLNAFDVVDAGEILKRIDVSPAARVQLERVGKIIEGGRPVVFATGHVGNWEILGQYLGGVFTTCRFVAQEQSNKFVDRYINTLRTKYMENNAIIHSHEAARELPRALKRGEPILLVADQDAGREGVIVDFMGTPASYHRGVASFSFHYDAPLVSLFLIRANRKLNLVISAIVEPNREAPREAEIMRLTAVFSEQLGNIVRRYPDQWLWTHRRWKSTVGKY